MQICFYNKSIYKTPIEARKDGALHSVPYACVKVNAEWVKGLLASFCQCAGLDLDDWGACYVNGFSFRTLDEVYICEVF